jgi:hypothetical protein
MPEGDERFPLGPVVAQGPRKHLVIDAVDSATPSTMPIVNILAPNVGVTQVGERVWLVTFMRYDLGYFDDETCRLEPIDNPFDPKVLPMCSE